MTKYNMVLQRATLGCFSLIKLEEKVDEEEAEEAFSECPQVLEFNFHLATLYKEFLLFL